MFKSTNKCCLNQRFLMLFNGLKKCLCIYVCRGVFVSVWCNTVAGCMQGAHPNSWYPSVSSSPLAACGSESEVHWHAVSGFRPEMERNVLQECARAYECGLCGINVLHVHVDSRRWVGFACLYVYLRPLQNAAVPMWSDSISVFSGR